MDAHTAVGCLSASPSALWVGLATTFAAVAGSVWWFRRVSDGTQTLRRAARSLGLRGGPLGPWSAGRSGLRIELNPVGGTLTVSGLPEDVVLGPGPGSTTGDPTFDREVLAEPDVFGAAARAALSDAVRRGLHVRRGVLFHTGEGSDPGDLQTVLDLALATAALLRGAGATARELATGDPVVSVRVHALRRLVGHRPEEWVRELLEDPSADVAAAAAEVLLPGTRDLLLELARRPGCREALRVCLERRLDDADTLLANAWERGERDVVLFEWIGRWGGRRWFVPLATEPSARTALSELSRRFGAPDTGGLALAADTTGSLTEPPAVGGLAAPRRQPARETP